MSTAGAPPIVGVGRLRGVDVARGVALLGMMSVHVLPQITASGRTTGSYLVFGGRASALFALLAGVGLALATGGERPKLRPRRAVAAKVLTRALLVASIGLALGSLDPPVGVILANYGLLFAVALVYIGLPSRALLLLATAWVVTTPLLSHVLRTHLPVDEGTNPSFADLAHPRGLLIRLVLTGNYPVLQWTAYLLVGLAIGRLPLRRAATAVGLAISGLALAVLSRVMSDLLLAQGFSSLGLAATGTSLDVVQVQGPEESIPPTTTWWWQVVAAPHTATPFDLAHTIGTALLVLGLALLLGGWIERASSRWRVLVGAPFAVLAAAGSMTLTLYTLHVLLLTMHLGPDSDSVGDGAFLLLQVSTALAVACLWRWCAARGPLEAVVAHAASRAAALATASGQPRSTRPVQEPRKIVTRHSPRDVPASRSANPPNTELTPTTDFPHADQLARPRLQKKRFVMPGVALVVIASAYLGDRPKGNPVAPDADYSDAVSDVEQEYGTFAAVSRSGRGAMTIAVPAGGDAGIVTATHRGSSHFVVRGVDSDGEPTIDGGLVNVIGTYAGTTAYGLTELSETPDKLQITADDSWTIKIAAISAAPLLLNSASGKGPKVFRHDGDVNVNVDVAITQKDSSKFTLQQYSDDTAKDVHGIGNYSGTVPFVAGPTVVVIGADGTWTLHRQG